MGEGQHTVAVTATDLAGNSDGTPATRTFTVDTVAPTITVAEPTANQHFARGAAVASVFTCGDAGGSGVATCNAPATVDTASAGAKSFVVTAADVAGNQAAKTVPYIVDAPSVETPTPGPTGTPGPTTTPGPAITPPPSLASTPSVTAPRSATRAALAKGATVKLGDLKVGSGITLRVRSGSKTLATFRAIANALGKATLKVKLPTRLAKLRGKTLRLGYSLTTADGVKRSVSRKLKVK